jgi:hypothetical protein
MITFELSVIYHNEMFSLTLLFRLLSNVAFVLQIIPLYYMYNARNIFFMVLKIWFQNKLDTHIYI